MTDLVFDASEISQFGVAMAAAPAQMQGAMTLAASESLAAGISLAQGFAPVDEGVLRASIHITQGPAPSGGAYGTSLIYAWMREVGGTIFGRPWLVFQVGGRWVKTRKVTQTGTHYMARSAQALRPRLHQIYGRAIGKVLAGIGKAAD